MADTETIPGWLAELNAKYGQPHVAHPDPVNLGDRKRQCWVWFPGGKNYNLGIDQIGDRWVVRAAKPGGNGELTVYGKDRPSDAAIRGVLVTAGLLAEVSHQFLLGDGWTEITCPDCHEPVTVVDGHVYPRGSGTGIPLDHPPTLGDLIDAADAHECETGESGD